HNTEKAVKSPNLTKRTNHHKPIKAHAGVQKLLQRKINCLPNPTGHKKGRQKVEHNHMPTNPSMQPKH
ncbi:hypothetical protein, partial [Corynebacterium accolens]|uniref:hypothetical protein n=1 Tax=Corynebacterium accolens TaxID=38284 RepID=UPI001ED9FA59